MNPSYRIPYLRYELASAYTRQQRNNTHATPGLHHLLPVPIKERLVLLAKIDGADHKEIRRTLPVSRDDALAISPQMLDAIKLWQQTLDDAYWHVPTRSNWRFQKEASVEKGLKQLLWSDVAVALLGDAALPEVVQNIPLRKRLILYCWLVEELRWWQIQELFRCTRHEIRRSIALGLKAIGGA